MPPDIAKLLGRHVRLDHTVAPMAPCRYCDGREGIIQPGNGPHLAQVRCLGCNRSLGWLSSQWLSYLLARDVA